MSHDIDVAYDRAMFGPREEDGLRGAAYDSEYAEESTMNLGTEHLSIGIFSSATFDAMLAAAYPEESDGMAPVTSLADRRQNASGTHGVPARGAAKD